MIAEKFGNVFGMTSAMTFFCWIYGLSTVLSLAFFGVKSLNVIILNVIIL